MQGRWPSGLSASLGAGKCQCPKDSDKPDAKFKAITQGNVWVGRTGGLAAAKLVATGTSLADFCGTSNCKPHRIIATPTDRCPLSPLIGTWTSTKVTGQWHSRHDAAFNYTAQGGAGVQLTIAPKGAVTVNYNGMARMNYVNNRHVGSQNIKVNGHDTLLGTQTGTMQLAPNNAVSGAWKLTPGRNSASYKDKVTSPWSLPEGTTTLADAFAKGITPYLVTPMSSGTWSISGKTLSLTLTFPSNDGPTTGTWRLTRK